jgi:hypothetical protein
LLFPCGEIEQEGLQDRIQFKQGVSLKEEEERTTGHGIFIFRFELSKKIFFLKQISMANRDSRKLACFPLIKEEGGKKKEINS